MRKLIVQIAFSLLVSVCARADTTLTINGASPYGCLQNAYIDPTPPQITTSFTLPAVSGSGSVHSVIPGYALFPRGGLCDTTVYYRNLGG
jgi:hypothetical protein